MSAVLEAAVAKVTAGRSPAPRVYKFGAVPAKPVYPYSVIGATGDQALNYTLDASHGTRDFRVWVQSFGQGAVGADQALAYDEAATTALLDQPLALTGYDCGPGRLQVGGAMTRDPDDSGVVGVTSAFIFTTAKEA